MRLRSLVHAYYQLTKPGIIYGNLLAASAGFLLAARKHVDYGLLIATLLSIALIIASACVFNNYIDRNIDKKMTRTKHRSLATNSIKVSHALFYASVLGIIGFGILTAYTNWLTVSIGIIGVVDYLLFYGLAKRRTPFSTIIGSLSGAMPPVAGYTAVTNHFDGAALLLLILFVCWQMPHFYTIAVYRFNDYKSAGLPVLPVKKGILTTKLHVLLYIIVFLLAIILLDAFNYIGLIYVLIMAAISIVWLIKGVRGFYATDDKKWGRSMFLFSLVVITALCILIPLGAIFR